MGGALTSEMRIPKKEELRHRKPSSNREPSKTSRGPQEVGYTFSTMISRLAFAVSAYKELTLSAPLVRYNFLSGCTKLIF